MRLPVIAALDDLASRFVQTLDEGIVETTAQVLVDYTDPKAPLYLKIMQKIKENGIGYVKEETSRLTKLLKGLVSLMFCVSTLCVSPHW